MKTLKEILKTFSEKKSLLIEKVEEYDNNLPSTNASSWTRVWIEKDYTPPTKKTKSNVIKAGHYK